MEDTLNNKMSGEEIVITGMSGIFPKSDSVSGLMENLYNKVDMVSDEPRWVTTDPELPHHNGKVSGIEKFDAQFFKIGSHQAMVLEPICRKILEHAYGAIFDSGNTTTTLKGKHIGVFIGSSFADFSSLSFYNMKKTNDLIVGGNSKSMLANRVSYWMDSKGPSFTLDFACASSAAALEEAYNCMKSGDCDGAIVGAGNLCTHPMLSLNMQRYGLLCMDGKTKCFDKNGDGYVRSEAISLIFLQKAKDAKRIYAEVYHTKGAFKLGADSNFLPMRNSKDIQEFIKDVYSETDIDPSEIEYVEANAAAIAKADNNEIEAIAKIFGGNKTLKVGSVKSNMGHTEPVSGLCALTKLCLAYHKGELPANIHCNDPIEILQEVSINIVTENTKFNRGYAALNNFSFTGANFHVILKGHYKEKNLSKYKTDIPRLVLASGRQESSVKKIFEELKKKPIDAEEIGLLHDIFSNDIMGHTERGYSLFYTNEKDETVSVPEKIDYYPGLRRPLWFVYSGMGSQWICMGADLMNIPVFASAMERCHKVLEPKGLDLIKILTEPDNKIFDNVLNSFVGISAVQIGLTDILKKIDIVPDFIIGHSLGEMACAYHDETLTLEELMLATYSRGKAVLESDLKPGLMAAVGLGYQELKNICPQEIDIACHNSNESATISGPVESMKRFIAELTKQGIFVREVPSANIAYHSRYVADAGEILLTLLKETIKEPKLRSEKWISTSVPRENWESFAAKYSSAEYFTNNLLNPVLFEEMSTMIPANAVVVEIAPHGLLQSILKRSHPECTHIPLTRRGNKDGVRFLLDAIGKLYNAGYNPKIGTLYPKIEYPVSTGTPLLSHLVEWEHSEDWPLLENENFTKVSSTCRNMSISVHDVDYAYIQDYVIDGVNIVPEATILVFVWETLAMYKGMAYHDMSVIFRDIQFHGCITIVLETPIKFTVTISKGNNRFEVSQDDKLIVSGIVSSARVVKFRHSIENYNNDDDFDRDDIELNSEDIYKIFSSRGYSYGSKFKTIHSTSLEVDKALIKWTNDWALFLDGLIQLNALSRNVDGTSKPNFIRQIRISVLEQENQNKKAGDLPYCEAQLFKTYGVTRCAGVEIEDITFIDKPVKEKVADLLKTRAFYPFINTNIININTSLKVNLQIIKENSSKKDINIINMCGLELTRTIDNIINGTAQEIFHVKNVTNPNSDFVKNVLRNQESGKINVVVIENLLKDKMKIKILQGLISNDVYVITLESEVPKQIVKEHFTIMTSMSDGSNILLMMQKVTLKHPIEDVCYMTIPFDKTFSWVPKVLFEIDMAKEVVLVSENQPYCGLYGFVKKLKMSGYNNVSLIVIDDFHAPKFDPEHNLYKEQMSKKLTINVLKKGQWGGFYYTPTNKSANVRNIILKSLVPGDLDKLTWIETCKTSAEKNFVQVCYAGISVKDYENALIKSDVPLGMEYSGIDKSGEKIMGLVSGGSLASTIEVDEDLIWPVPDSWTLEDAATVPLAYLQAYYALVLRGGITQNQAIFINGAPDALNQALISICLGLECTVFTTVNNEKQKKTLLELFPSLNETHIGYTNDYILLQTVKDLTRKGCNIVINCGIGSSREDAMKFVGEAGIFLDLSVEDMKVNKNFNMGFITRDRSYKAVNLLNIFRPEYQSEKKLLQLLVSEGIANGIVQPLPRIVFASTDVKRAFRFVALTHRIGKVLVRMRDPKVKIQDLNAVARLEYSPEDVIIIICDEQGIGIELAERLIKRGVRKLVLHTKTNKISGYIHSKIASWGKQGVSLKLSSENLQTDDGCRTFTKNSRKFGIVKGLFIVFDTKFIDKANKYDFVNSFNEKCLVLMNMELSSRNFMDLREFVIISPLPQSLNDEYALSLIDEVSDMRNEMGLPTMVFRYQYLESDGAKSKCDKTPPTSLSALFNSLEASLKLKQKNVLAFEMKEIRGDFHEKVYKILGIKDVNSVNVDILIENLNLDVTVLYELRSLIYEWNQVEYPITYLLKMSVESIINLGAKHKTTPIDGIYTFIKKVDNEEDYLASESIVEMSTLHNDYIGNKISKQLPDCLLMIPGFEGRAEIFNSVAERLKIQALCVQLEPDLQGDSIEEIAAEVRKTMKLKCLLKHKFYLFGYSFGVDICLELARILESEGYEGTIYCLDSSPEVLKTQLETHIGSLEETELQNKIITHIFTIMTGQHSEYLKIKIQDIDSFSGKIDVCLKEMEEIIKYSKDYKRNILESIYKRVVLAKEYEPNFVLKSRIVLMKSSQCLDLPYDYGLSKYSTEKVEVFQLKQDHANAPSDCRVSNVVNQFLDPNILEDFKKTNCCDVYLC